MVEEQKVVCSVSPSKPLKKPATIRLDPEKRIGDFEQARRVVGCVASDKPADPMLLSWYDRDRDFESPQHVSECHAAGAIPGYVDYGINHGATLKIDVEKGRFVFYYMDFRL